MQVKGEITPACIAPTVAGRLGQAMMLSPQPSETLPERSPVRKSATYLQPEKEKDLQPIEATSP